MSSPEWGLVGVALFAIGIYIYDTIREWARCEIDGEIDKKTTERIIVASDKRDELVTEDTEANEVYYLLKDTACTADKKYKEI